MACRLPLIFQRPSVGRQDCGPERSRTAQGGMEWFGGSFDEGSLTSAGDRLIIVTHGPISAK
jgi:hypothetical protein